MLLKFEFENYKCFAKNTVFSMQPADKQRDIEYSVCREKIKGIRKEIKAVCSSVIYGANASGKTNIISAMCTFKAIILRGNIRNEKIVSDSNNPSASKLELIPNFYSDSPKPVHFSIEFITDNMKVGYEISIDVGTFLNINYDRKVVFERLVVNDVEIYSRNNSEVTFNDNLPASLRKFIRKFDKKHEDIFTSSISLKKDELFLNNAFRIIFAPDLTEIITHWLEEKFIIICGFDKTRMIPMLPEDDNVKLHKMYTNKSLNQALEQLGVNSSKVGFISEKEGSIPKLFSEIKIKNTKIQIQSDIFESLGTTRFVDLFPMILGGLCNGATIVIDEFDASIHPMALLSIINIFHNDEINTRHAQLIFNTHNPVFLNGNVFRRDEIKFVERNDETSIIYSLSDFQTSGINGVRKGEDYMKHYFINKYGAINDIDFSQIFEDAMKNSVKKQEK